MELMDYLSEHSRSEVKRLPDLILLDLNIPQKDGLQALFEIKSEPSLQHLLKACFRKIELSHWDCGAFSGMLEP